MKKNKPAKFYRLKCVKCGKVCDETVSYSNCPKCGGPLEAEYDWEYIRSRLNAHNLRFTPVSAAKYLKFYPILDLNKLVTLNEGGTQLRKSKKIASGLGLENLYFKDETSNPTGGFKDRGSLVEITKALEMGAKAVVVASTGNMAASVAAYAAKAGMPVYIVVPEGTPIGKLAQTLSYGARVMQVRATYSECARLAEQIAKKYGFYLAGDYVFRGEGQKSQGYEIVEQLSWKSPDYLVVPVGCGTNLSAVYKGIREFRDLGFIDKVPKVIGVQAKGANTLVRAFRKKTKKIVPIAKPDTVASAVAVGYPNDGLKVLNILEETGGRMAEVSDDEILRAEKKLASEESIFVEPSAAMSIAAVEQLARKKLFKKDDVIVCVLTGNGLKDPVSLLRLVSSPPSIEPRMSDVDEYLRMKLYNIKGADEKEKEELLWKKTPDDGKIKAAVKGNLGIDISKKYLGVLSREIHDFFQKGKELRRSDLQHIVEDVLKTDPDAPKLIEVEDFSVVTCKKRKASGEVRLRIKNKKTVSSSAEGVGPVDAVMRAVRAIIEKEKLMNYWLTDFNVKIDRRGTDATVETTMSLKDDKGNKVIATATSPDVVAASIEAFERGYNILYNKNIKK